MAENQEELEPQKNEAEPEPKEGQEPEPEAKSEEEQLTPEQIADLKKRAEASSQNFERAKKAEEEIKKLKSAKTQEGLSALDAVALAKAEIHEEDIDELVEYANYKRITVRDALKSPLMQNMLKDRAEERRTALATHTKGGQRSAAKASGEELLAQAEKTGEIPED